MAIKYPLLFVRCRYCCRRRRRLLAFFSSKNKIRKSPNNVKIENRIVLSVVFYTFACQYHIHAHAHFFLFTCTIRFMLLLPFFVLQTFKMCFLLSLFFSFFSNSCMNDVGDHSWRRCKNHKLQSAQLVFNQRCGEANSSDIGL